MNATSTEPLTIVIEREISAPPERIWRALTESHLIAEWLMTNDFRPVVGHRFTLRAGWGVIDCEVLVIEPNRKLSHTWAAHGVESTVTWSLTPTDAGTHLRMEHSGFGMDQRQSYQGAQHGWPRFIRDLERVIDALGGAPVIATKSIVVERRIPHNIEKVWRALTVSHLVAEWLMENDFVPEVGHQFTFHAKPVPGWSGVTHCEVLAIEPSHLLAYSWGDGTESDSGLKTVVTWTLSSQGDATLVRMEQSGFRPEDARGYAGMGNGWPRILTRLEKTAAALS